MSRAVNAIVIGVAVFVLLAGSIWYVMVVREPNRIRATTERGWDDAGGEAFWVRSTFHNPYDYEVRFHRYDYRFLVNGDEFASGGNASQETVRPGGTAQLELRVDFPQDAISAWFRSHVENEESTKVQFRGEAIFSLSDRNTTVPFGYEEEFSTSLLESLSDADECEDARTVCFAGADARWGQKDDAVVLQVDADLENPTDDEAHLGNSTLDITLAGTTVANAKTSGGLIEPDDDLGVRFLVFFEHERLMDWWPSHASTCEESEAVARVSLEVDFEKPEEEDETNGTSPTPVTSRSNETNGTSPSTSSSSPKPTKSTSTSASPTNTTEQTRLIARASAVRPTEIPLEPVRTRFVCDEA